MAEKYFHFGDEYLTPSLVFSILNNSIDYGFSKEGLKRIQNSAGILSEIVASGETVYGVNTGFGILASEKISSEDTRILQHKILQSHSVGVGDPVPDDIVKLMLITKLQSLSLGYSGVQVSTIERILWHLKEEILPVVPEKGSVGASGDLAPLAHLFLPLIGMGKVKVNGRQEDSLEVLNKYGLAPLTLGPKEGLALINGTQFILAYGLMGLKRMHNCLDAADIIGAMSLESLTGTKAPFREELHELRAFRGNVLVAQRLRNLLKDSGIMESHLDCGRVQDPYSLRCMPQVHGASRNSWLHLKDILTIEMNSVTDNPVILKNGDTISGGNFHGQPLALPIDYAAIAAAEIGNISDRRCYLMLEGKWGLPVLLMNNVGLNSGFMIPQYTTAALVSENKSLCFPASADSIPTSLGQEDHVSMGSISSRKFNMILENLEHILGIELMTACQAIEFRRPLKSSSLLENAHDFIRNSVSFADEDRIFARDIQIITGLIKNESFVRNCRAFESSKGINMYKDFEDFDL